MGSSNTPCCWHMFQEREESRCSLHVEQEDILRLAAKKLLSCNDELLICSGNQSNISSYTVHGEGGQIFLMHAYYA